jgi:hypothetical protein
MPRCRDSKTDLGATLQAKVDPCPWTTPGFSTAAYVTDIENRRTSELQAVSTLSRPLFNEADINRRQFVIHVYPYVPKKGGRYNTLHTLMPNNSSGPRPKPEKVNTTMLFHDELTPTTQEKFTTTCEFDVP